MSRRISGRLALTSTLLLLGFLLIWGCSDEALPMDGEVESPDLGKPNNPKPYVPPPMDASVEPEQSDVAVETPCGTFDLVPPELRGDIEYPEPDSTDVVILGLGHDTRRDEFLQSCVRGESASNDGEDTVFEVHEIETRTELSERLKLDTRVRAGFFGIKVENRFNMARSRKINMHNLNIWVRVRVQTGSEALVRNVRMSPDNEAILSMNPFEFERRCGDRFVQKITYGGELIVILSVTTTNETDRRQLSNRLSASFGLWGSASVGVSTEVSEALSGRELTWLVERTGGGGALPNFSTPEEFFLYARRFPQIVADNDPAVFEYVTRPYDRVATTEVCLPGFDRKAIELMEDAWDKVNEAIGVRNALEDAIENPRMYACGNNQQRRAQLEALESYIDEVDDLTEQCGNELLSGSSSSINSQSCRALTELLSEYEETPMPLRWQTETAFRPSSTQRSHTLQMPSDQFCRDTSISGSWQKGRGHSRQPCPEGQMSSDGKRYELTYPDNETGDNSGDCEYRFGCMNEQDAYLIDQCIP